MIYVIVFAAGWACGAAALWLWGRSASRRQRWLLHRDYLAMRDAGMEHFDAKVRELRKEDR